MPVVTSEAATTVTDVDAFSEPVDFTVQYDHPMSAAVRGMRLDAEPVEQDTSDEVRVLMSIASNRADDAISVQKIVPLEDFQELAARVQAIAPWGEDGYYPEEVSNQRVWDTMDRLLRGAASAPDLAAFLASTHLGNMTIRQV